MRANSRVSIGVLFLKGGRAHIRSAEGPLTQICGWVEFGELVSEATSPLIQQRHPEARRAGKRLPGVLAHGPSGLRYDRSLMADG